VEGRLAVGAHDPRMTQAAPCESADDAFNGALMVTSAASADVDFGASGMAIERCSIVDPLPPIRPELEAQLIPPAAPKLVWSRRRETIMAASLRERSISEYVIQRKENTLVELLTEY